ncbi:MAG: ATP-dependent DNA helicase RecG, partial [Phycisphaerae bacterium]
GRCNVRWFNSPFVADRLRVHDVIRLSGKVGQHNDLAVFANPRFTVIDPDEDALADDQPVLRPVYPAGASLGSRQIGQYIRNALPQVAGQVEDFLPRRIRDRRKLPPRRTAIERLHQPTCQDDVPVARTRLAFDELFLLQLAVQIRRHRVRDTQQAIPVHISPEIDGRIRARLPFTLTEDQDAAVADVAADLAGDRPMCRLLQADVGAGKTAVAVYAALAVVANRHQAAILAPTEVLAQQHHRKVTRYLRGSRVRIAYLVGGLGPAQREKIHRDIAAGRVDLIVGTHALLQAPVRFASLALVVVDEQHRFGVTQRAAIRRKGRQPHYLVLTATPIPRTLAMTVFGDLDVSVIRQMPPGRGRVETRLVRSSQIDEAWHFVRQRLSRGERAFVVYPLVEQSEHLPLKAATDEVDALRAGPLAGFSVGLLHGRMKSSEKQAAMDAFRTGSWDVLVATTVVEVGVDIPEATVMVVQHAERFGLSQLHQLRGRIGRGGNDGHCLLISDAADSDAGDRLETLVATSDGFEIAEQDLRLRGPGELMGTRQHGLPIFKAARLPDDLELLDQARRDALEVIRSDPRLTAQRHAALRRQLLTRFGQAMALADVA